MVININVKDKRAVPDGSVIVCGNSDYQIKFTFDEEWDGLTFKTARFVYRKAGEMRFIDVSFAGDTVDVPTLTEIRYVYVGVYADELQTTTPAEIACEYSILCNSGGNEYEYTQEDRSQLMALFNMAVKEQAAAKEAAKTATEARDEAKDAADLATEAIGSVVSRVKESNNGKYVTFWVGKQAEYDALETVDGNCLYIITDDAACQSIDITDEISLTLKAGYFRDYIFHGYDEDGNPITTPIAPYKFSYDQRAGIVRFELHIGLREVTPRKSITIVTLDNYIPQATMQALSVVDQQCFGDYSAYIVSSGSTAAIGVFAAQGLGEYEAVSIDISGWYFCKGE